MPSAVLYIAGMGMISPLGTSVVTTVAAVNAGLAPINNRVSTQRKAMPSMLMVAICTVIGGIGQLDVIQGFLWIASTL